MDWPPRTRAAGDLLIVAAIVAAVATGSFRAGRAILPNIRLAQDVWFASDTPRIFANMVARDSNHHRTEVHPLFSLTAYSSVFVGRKLAGLPPESSVLMTVAGWSSAVAALFFTLLRIIGCSRGAAVLFTVLLAVSSAGMFWFPVPETYALGTISLLAALIAAALADRRELRPAAYVAISAGTLSFTVTNWITGLALTFLRCSWKRALVLSMGAFVIVVLLCGIERAIFPTAEFFFDPLPDERRHLYKPDGERLMQVSRAFAFHSVIMPEPKALGVSHSLLPWLHTQHSALASQGPWSQTALVVWTALLGLGTWSLVALPGYRVLRATLAITLASQFTLHVIYGDETFLYSLHFAPLLIVVVALASLMRGRRIVLGLTAGLIVCGGVNNARHFDNVVSLLESTRSGSVADHPRQGPR